jgi:hypothetical protein
MSRVVIRYLAVHLLDTTINELLNIQNVTSELQRECHVEERDKYEQIISQSLVLEFHTFKEATELHHKLPYHFNFY